MNAVVKDTPILFSGALPGLILAGTKTQTRRIIKPQPAAGWAIESPPVLGRITSAHPKAGRFGVFIRRGLGTDFPETDLIPCPYGQPGDRLWVRETWAYHLYAQASLADDDGPWVYAADGEPAKQFRLCDRWRPSIHMPRYASRISLKITGLRVERLHDITEADCIAEGIQRYRGPLRWVRYLDAVTGEPIHNTARDAFKALWESINGPGSWEVNPWLWVISFRRIT